MRTLEMKTSSHAFFWVLVLCAACLLVGCGRSPTDRCSISGTITLNGEPVDGGNIQINPLDTKQKSASGAMIQAGRYTIPRETGVVPGKYRVRIFWAEKIDVKDLPSPADPGPRKKIKMPKELIPAKYNSNSDLTIEVVQGVANRFDFALPMKPSARQ